MTLHIEIAGTNKTFCDARGSTISMRSLVRFFPLTVIVMWLFGCRDCRDELRDALRHARPIR